MGRLVRVCGAIGVSTSASTRGWTIGPPAARLYAVEPVAVATIRPSALTLVTRLSPTEMLSSMIRDSAALVNTTSLSTTRESKHSVPRKVSALSIARRSDMAVPARTASSDVKSSSMRVSVRKPRLPKLTPRIGTSRPDCAMRVAMPSSVPSPPSTTTRSTLSAGSSSREAWAQPAA